MRRPRYAKLIPRFGSFYPAIPADHWIPASQAAIRWAERLWREAGAEALAEGRLLPDAHFEFKGGKPRPSGWCIDPERLSDNTPADGT